MASEVIFDSEVYFVSEVAPVGAVANLTPLHWQLHFCTSKDFTENKNN